MTNYTKLAKTISETSKKLESDYNFDIKSAIKNIDILMCDFFDDISLNIESLSISKQIEYNKQKLSQLNELLDNNVNDILVVTKLYSYLKNKIKIKETENLLFYCCF